MACYREPRPTETPLKDPPFNSIAQTVKKPSVSEDLWSTSTVDMDNITFPSQGGSISSSNQTFDSQSVARNSNPPPEFVNQGNTFPPPLDECVVFWRMVCIYTKCVLQGFFFGIRQGSVGWGRKELVIAIVDPR